MGNDKQSISKTNNIAWSFVDAEIDDSKRPVEFDPWNPDSQALAVVSNDEVDLPQFAENLVEAFSFATTVDPWNLEPSIANENVQIHFVEPNWLPSFDKTLKQRPQLLLAVDGPRFDNIKIRIQWILGAVGPTPRSDKTVIQGLLQELLEVDQGNEVKFRKLHELAINSDSHSEFRSALSLKLWWLRRPEYWKVKGKGPWNFRFEESAKGAMTFPMCQEIAISAGLPSTWDHLPTEDWLTDWQSIKYAHISSWTFAEWVYLNTTQPNFWDNSTNDWKTDEIELDRMSIERVLTGIQRKGSNIGSGTTSRPNGIAPLLRERLKIWNEKQDKRAKHAKRRVTSSYQHMGESGEQTQKDRQSSEPN